ncbi:MAG: DUF2752 domain-containing protein [Muribaculaceae bacterium]|nr:DUF2752 domain-containing protein [Muribaculaceae bacterium]
MLSKRTVLALVLGILICLLAVVYFFFDPMDAGWMPRCIWKVATGTDCPGCGSQRMAHALMHGDLPGAWRANAYALCLLPLIALMLWLEFFREKHPRFYGKLHSPAVIRILGASVLGWWILRNVL